MKRLILLFSFFCGVTTHAVQDFSGNWVGFCDVDGVSTPSQRIVAQSSEVAMTLDGLDLRLDRPTSVEILDSDRGNAFKEVKVYDYQWNFDTTQIIASVKWVGWYLNQPGSWQGSSYGVMKIESGRLVTTRFFEGQAEICFYDHQP